MGPESKSDDYTLYLDGEPIARGEIQMPEITLPPEMLEPVKELTMQWMGFELHYKIPKRWRCGSRKRFIKLLMSKGISRNQAGSVARVARIAGVQYPALRPDGDGGRGEPGHPL